MVLEAASHSTDLPALPDATWSTQSSRLSQLRAMSTSASRNFLTTTVYILKQWFDCHADNSYLNNNTYTVLI